MTRVISSNKNICKETIIRVECVVTQLQHCHIFYNTKFQPL